MNFYTAKVDVIFKKTVTQLQIIITSFILFKIFLLQKFDTTIYSALAKSKKQYFFTQIKF
jgi:hypothetical protein